MSKTDLIPTTSAPAARLTISRPDIGPDEIDAVVEVLRSGALAQGSRTQMFEEEFATAVGARHAVATTSGTSALHLAFLAHGIGPGDEVITTAFTFVATANAILFVGARPIFADVDPSTYLIDIEHVRRLITPRTKAIIPVHLYGLMCDMSALDDLATSHGLVIIQDACQAVGATLDRKGPGVFGTSVFSLYATKNVTSGEGGVLTTNDESIDRRARLLRNHGMSSAYEYEELGYNYRMTDINAAIGLAQIRRLSSFLARRRENAEYLRTHITSVRVPDIVAGREHAWHQFTVRAEQRAERDRLRLRLQHEGIGTGIYYPRPVYAYPHLRAYAPAETTRAEWLADRVLSLPVHPLITLEDAARIASIVDQR